MRNVISSIISASLIFAALPVGAQPKSPPPVKVSEVPAKDATGARDAAALPRYAGSILLEAKATAFDEITLANAPLQRAGTRRDGRNNALNLPPDPIKVEGRMTRLMYLLPEGRSPLELIRGYQQVVRDAGGKVLFECNRNECGGSGVNGVSQGGSETGVIHMLYPYEMVSRTAAFCALDNAISNARYTLLDLANDGGKAAVITWNIPEVSAGSDCKAWVGRLVAMVVVVETAVREQRMETVKASAMEASVNAQGRVALYSILFDTDRADIKVESQPQIAELVTYLKAAPAVKALIVGHTDNQGSLDHNLDLSKRRAQSVVAALTRGGIPAARLSPQGVGMAAPLATNETDDGRTKNRRVELVKQ